MEHTGASTDDRIVADSHCRAHKHVRCDPYPIPHHDGGRRRLKMRILIIVACSAEEAFLRDHSVAAYFDRRGRIEPGIITDGRIITYFNAPGIMQPGPGPEDHPLSDLTTKDPHQPAAEAIEGDGREPE